jgi:methyl-accepting chemotaxis protein
MPAAPLSVPNRGPRAAPSGLADFFRYHGAWSPGVRLFRRIGFRSKALIISMVFLLPIAHLCWNYFTAQQGAIGFSAKERLGVTYARALMPVLRVLQDDRLAALTVAQAGAAQAPAAPADAAAALSQLQAVQATLGEALGTAAAWKRLQEAAIQAEGVKSGADAVFAARTAHVAALLDLLGVATDGSNLTLDPDIDTYYLMDAALFRLPVMLEAVAQLRGLGVTALGGAQASPAQVRRVVEQQAALATNLAAMEAGIAKAVAYNAEVAAAVQLQQALVPLKQFAGRVESTVLAEGGPKGDADAHVAAANETLAALQALGTRATDRLDVLVAARVDRMAWARNLTAVVLVLSLLVAVYLFVAFRKVLEGGLNEVAFHIDAMRDGDLTTQPRAWGADEAARLMHTLAEMQGSLRRIVSQVRSASDTLVGSSEEISSGAHDLHARTEQSAANLQETASAMEQIAATVKNNADTLEQATGLAGSNADAAERGGRVIQQVVQTMHGINVSSGRISEIIGTIDGIAFQTNILALNAAVEAARAGEQGRGFAVVAGEVRALAQRSASAAREIKSLITQSVEEVEGGVRVAGEAGQAIEALMASALRVRELLTEVAVGSREQNQGVAQSARAVQELDNVTQQNAALVEQTAAAAGMLKAQAHGLAGEVSRFRLPAH